MIESLVAARKTGITAWDSAPALLELILLLASVGTTGIIYSKASRRCPAQRASQNSASPEPTWAGLDTLGPCIFKLCVASISTILEPSTVPSATGAFTGFLGSTALETHQTHWGWRSYDREWRHDAWPPWFGAVINTKQTKQIHSMNRTHQAITTCECCPSKSRGTIHCVWCICRDNCQGHCCVKG